MLIIYRLILFEAKPTLLLIHFLIIFFFTKFIHLSILEGAVYLFNFIMLNFLNKIEKIMIDFRNQLLNISLAISLKGLVSILVVVVRLTFCPSSLVTVSDLLIWVTWRLFSHGVSHTTTTQTLSPCLYVFL